MMNKSRRGSEWRTLSAVVTTFILVGGLPATVRAGDPADQTEVANDPAATLEQLRMGNEKWEERGVDSYRIDVMRFRSIWHAQNHTVALKNGIVSDHSAYCVAAPMEQSCEVEKYDPQELTVEGLFASAEQLLVSDEALKIRVRFNPV